MEHQEFLFELAVESHSVRGKEVANPITVAINKVAVEEKAKTFKLMGSSGGIFRSYIKKTEMLKVFDLLGDVYIYCNKEEDIPKMYDLAQQFLQGKADRAMHIYNKNMDKLKYLKDHKGGNNNA